MVYYIDYEVGSADINMKMGGVVMQLLTFTLNKITFGIPIQNIETIQSRGTVLVVPIESPDILGITDLQ